jgi:hypothetical protein
VAFLGGSTRHPSETLPGSGAGRTRRVSRIGVQQLGLTEIISLKNAPASPLARKTPLSSSRYSLLVFLFWLGCPGYRVHSANLLRLWKAEAAGTASEPAKPQVSDLPGELHPAGKHGIVEGVAAHL